MKTVMLYILDFFIKFEDEGEHHSMVWHDLNNH